MQNGMLLEHLLQSNWNSGTYSPQNGHGVFVSTISSLTGLRAIFSIYFLYFSLIFGLYSGFIRIAAH